MPLIKMLKGWNFSIGKYFRSFHIEVLALQILGNVKISDFPSGVRYYFDKGRTVIKDKNLDPAGFGDDLGKYINTQQKVQEAVAKFELAYDRPLRLRIMLVGDMSKMQWRLGPKYSETTFQRMADQTTTAEIPVSKAKDEIIKEAKRIEEALLFSSKRHFKAASLWSGFHLFIGVPVVLISAVAGATAFAQFDKSHVIAGVLSLVVAALTSVMTFLNPNEKAAAHQNAGNKYDSLMSKLRMFWSIDCWQTESEEVLTEKLKYFAEQRDTLNLSCPQTPHIAYLLAKRGIEAGEAKYKVDDAIVKT